MEYIGKRISIQRKEAEASIVILSTADKTKNGWLTIWFILWTISGMIVFSQYFVMKEENEKVMLLVWLFFWAYFEYKIFKVFMWRKFGVEKIKIRNGKLQYKRDRAGKGKIREYQLNLIKDLRLIELKENSFADNLNQSYWVIAGERLVFDYEGKEIKLGLQLEEKDAELLLKEIRKKIR